LPSPRSPPPLPHTHFTSYSYLTLQKRIRARTSPPPFLLNSSSVRNVWPHKFRSELGLTGWRSSQNLSIGQVEHFPCAESVRQGGNENLTPITAPFTSILKESCLQKLLDSAPDLNPNPKPEQPFGWIITVSAVQFTKATWGTRNSAAALGV
jgi:hypothetical protein